TGPDRSAWDRPQRSAMTPGAGPNDDPSPRATSPGNRRRSPRTHRVHPVDPSDEAVSRSDTLLAAEPFRGGPESPCEALTGPGLPVANGPKTTLRLACPETRRLDDGRGR